MKSYDDKLVSRYQERLASFYSELKASRSAELHLLLAQIEKDFFARFGQDRDVEEWAVVH